MAAGHLRSRSGFTLVEVLVALSLMVVVSIGVVQLFAIALTAGHVSRDRTVAVWLATGKLEQLRSLEWRIELDRPGGLVRHTDVTSDVSVDPAAAGGPGLRDSPPGTLVNSAPGYADYLDRLGRHVGSGASPPSTAVYVRRWAVHHLPADPDVVVLQVRVGAVGRERSRSALSPHAWNGEDVLLTTMMTRRGR
jgi:prepilin-type N-terminal cleavage/methylation domain-containing protein